MFFVLIFHSTLVMITRFVKQLGAFAATKYFPSGLSLFENKCACCEHIVTIGDVLESFFFTSSLSPGSTSSHLHCA